MEAETQVRQVPRLETGHGPDTTNLANDDNIANCTNCEESLCSCHIGALGETTVAASTLESSPLPSCAPQVSSNPFRRASSATAPSHQPSHLSTTGDGEETASEDNERYFDSVEVADGGYSVEQRLRRSQTLVNSFTAYQDLDEGVPLYDESDGDSEGEMLEISSLRAALAVGRRATSRNVRVVGAAVEADGHGGNGYTRQPVAALPDHVQRCITPFEAPQDPPIYAPIPRRPFSPPVSSFRPNHPPALKIAQQHVPFSSFPPYGQQATTSRYSPLNRAYSSTSFRLLHQQATAFQQQPGGPSEQPPHLEPTKYDVFVSAAFSSKEAETFSRHNVYTHDPHARIIYDYDLHAHIRQGEETTNEQLRAITLENKQRRRAARADSGQDSFYVANIGPSPQSSSAPISFGVADGVGGYSDHGIDSAEFAHTLCQNLALASSRSDPPSSDSSATEPQIAPLDLLNYAYKHLTLLDAVAGGGSTACVALIDPSASPAPLLSVSNLGDSGYIILRPGKIAYISQPQTHDFNTPYQLSTIPEGLRSRFAVFGSVPLQDQPADADTTQHELRHGDVVIMATDGLWDNVSAAEVLGIVSREMVKRGAWLHESAPATPPPDGMTSSAPIPGLHAASNLSSLALPPTVLTPPASPTSESTPAPQEPQALATDLAQAILAYSKPLSMNPKHLSPFAREVRRHFSEEREYTGGKRDDICVVAAIVGAHGP